MLKRSMRIGLICALALSIAAIAVAQQAPVPVVRMGGAIELGEDLWVDFGGGAELRYQFVHNPDFESDIQDRPPARANKTTTPHTGSADIWFAQAQISVDAQYKKHLRFQVMMRSTMTWDGNRIDDGVDLDGDSPADRVFGSASDRNLACNNGDFVTGACDQRNTWNLERLWIDYTLPNTPLRFRLGADFWTLDEAALVADDDPRAGVYAKFDNLELYAGIVLENESMRIGLSNDNDNIMYQFRVRYDMKPFRFGVSAAYFRHRYDRDSSGVSEKTDTLLLMPSVAGSFGIISGYIQPMFNFGSMDAQDGNPATNYDVKSFGVAGAVTVNLAGGKIRPLLAFFYGTGDDDEMDGDLEGFFTNPARSIAPFSGNSHTSVFTSSSSGGARDVQTPALANLGSGFEFLHTVSNPFNDRVGNTIHSGVNTTYSNPGTLWIAPGVRIDLTQGHRLDLYYIYRGIIDSELVEAELVNREGANPNTIDIGKSMTHEFAATYTWTPSPHFDLRVFGSAVSLGGGGKDIAEAQDCDETVVGLQPCDGDEIALHGEIRLRARF